LIAAVSSAVDAIEMSTSPDSIS
jgi:hypothetical protein